MSTDQADRAIAAIDAVLTDDEISDIVDWQLSRYDERSGYDHDVNQPAACGHCGREEHGLAITQRIESMRWRGYYDEDYRYDEDTTPILCPGSYVPGPVGFGRAFRPAWLIEPEPALWHVAVGEPGPPFPGSRLGTVSADPWVIPDVPQQPRRYIDFRIDTTAIREAAARFDEQLRAFNAQLQQIGLSDLIGSLHAATFPSPLAPARDLTVRLIDASGRPIPLRNTKGSNIEPTDTGFTVELDLPPRGLRDAVRDRGPGGRIILEGPGGQRERIAGTVTEIALNDDGTRFEIDVASEHHHLPSVYADPEENQR